MLIKFKCIVYLSHQLEFFDELIGVGVRAVLYGIRANKFQVQDPTSYIMTIKLHVCKSKALELNFF